MPETATAPNQDALDQFILSMPPKNADPQGQDDLDKFIMSMPEAKAPGDIPGYPGAGKANLIRPGATQQYSTPPPVTRSKPTENTDAEKPMLSAGWATQQPVFPVEQKLAPLVRGALAPTPPPPGKPAPPGPPEGTEEQPLPWEQQLYQGRRRPAAPLGAPAAPYPSYPEQHAGAPPETYGNTTFNPNLAPAENRPPERRTLPPPAVPPGADIARPGPYLTPLTPEEQQQFGAFQQQTGTEWWTPENNGGYDLPGFFRALKAGQAKIAPNGHMPDTWKTPDHPTFSNQSMYATPNAPHWVGDRLYSRDGQLVADERDPLIKASEMQLGNLAYQHVSPQLRGYTEEDLAKPAEPKYLLGSPQFFGGKQGGTRPTVEEQQKQEAGGGPLNVAQGAKEVAAGAEQMTRHDKWEQLRGLGQIIDGGVGVLNPVLLGIGLAHPLEAGRWLGIAKSTDALTYEAGRVSGLSEPDARLLANVVADLPLAYGFGKTAVKGIAEQHAQIATDMVERYENLRNLMEPVRRLAEKIGLPGHIVEPLPFEYSTTRGTLKGTIRPIAIAGDGDHPGELVFEVYNAEGQRIFPPRSVERAGEPVTTPGGSADDLHTWFAQQAGLGIVSRGWFQKFTDALAASRLRRPFTPEYERRLAVELQNEIDANNPERPTIGGPNTAKRVMAKMRQYQEAQTFGTHAGGGPRALQPTGPMADPNAVVPTLRPTQTIGADGQVIEGHESLEDRGFTLFHGEGDSMGAIAPDGRLWEYNWGEQRWQPYTGAARGPGQPIGGETPERPGVPEILGLNINRAAAPQGPQGPGHFTYYQGGGQGPGAVGFTSPQRPQQQPPPPSQVQVGSAAQLAPPGRTLGPTGLISPQEMQGPPLQPPKPTDVQQVGPETPNAPEAAVRTTPESPETINIQLEQLLARDRHVVMLPAGTPTPEPRLWPGQDPDAVPLRYPPHMATTHDDYGNVYIFNPQLISRQRIEQAARTDQLNQILGAAGVGLGTTKPKKEMPPNAETVIVRAADGTEVQSTVTDENDKPGVIAVAQQLKPEGGSISVVPAEQVIAERGGAPTPGPTVSQAMATPTPVAPEPTTPTAPATPTPVTPAPTPTAPEGKKVGTSEVTSKVTPAPVHTRATYLSGAHSAALQKAAQQRKDIGLMITPYTQHLLKHAAGYPVIAIDNGVFSKDGFNEKKFRKLVEQAAANPEIAKRVRFVVAPDVLHRNPDGTVYGDAQATLDQFGPWADWIHSKGLPVAFVAQDGLENLREQIPWDKIDVLFIGGSDDWKLGEHGKEIGKTGAKEVPQAWMQIWKDAHAHGIPIHMGRVNSATRLHLAEYGLGATTVDGNYIGRGPAKNLPNVINWLNKQNGVETGKRVAVKQTDEVPSHPSRPDEEEVEKVGTSEVKKEKKPKVSKTKLARIRANGKQSEAILRKEGITTGENVAINRILDPRTVYHLARAVAGDVASGAMTIQQAAQAAARKLRESTRKILTAKGLAKLEAAIQRQLEDFTKLLKPSGPIRKSPLRQTKKEALEFLKRKMTRALGVGEPANERQEFTLPNGIKNVKNGTKIVVGKLTFDDWMQRVQFQLTAEELKQARAWYEELEGFFNQQFGRRMAPKLALAWLLGNQRASPTKAMTDVLRVMDEILGRKIADYGKYNWDAEKKEWKLLSRGGLAHDKIEAALQGLPIASGFFLKLSDFVESALQKSTRTFYGDDPRAGKPAVMDVWSTRDVGFVDGPLFRFLKKHLGSEAVDHLTLDMGDKEDAKKDTGVSETQYERGAEWMNDLSNHLNKVGFDGGNWTPAQVQAVGWVTMQKAMGSIPEFVKDIVSGNTYSIYAGSTPTTMRAIREAAKKLSSVKIINVEHGLGQTHVQLFASPESATDFMEALGYLTRAPEVWASRVLSSGSRWSIDIYHADGSSRDLETEQGRQALIAALRQHGLPDEYLQLVQPVTDPNGFAGIRMIKTTGKWENPRHRALIDATLAQIPGGYPVRTEDGGIELEHRENNWAKDKRGESYLKSLTNHGRRQIASWLRAQRWALATKGVEGAPERISKAIQSLAKGVTKGAVARASGRPGQAKAGKPRLAKPSAVIKKGTYKPELREIESKAANRVSLEQRGFFSQLGRVIDQKISNKISAKEALRILTKTENGIKQSELRWTGMGLWLESLGAQVITKQQIKDRFNAEKVIVEEATDVGGNYENYSTTGPHEHYTELALYHPNKYMGASQRYNDLYQELNDKYGDQWYGQDDPNMHYGVYWDNPNLEGTPYDPLTPAERQRWNKARDEERLEEQANERGFRGMHFGPVNTFAHVRFTTREIDGKKVLFLEEIQSDWHQKGRKWGYREAGTPEPPWQYDEVAQQSVHPPVPESPMMGDLWSQLAFRRMVRWAAANDYDGIAWATGRHQALRYRAGWKRARAIRWARTGEKDGKPYGRLEYIPRNAPHDDDDYYWERYENTDGIAQFYEEELGKYLKKDVAQQLLAQEPQQSPQGFPGYKTLKRRNLFVGEIVHGMRGFYDEILPNYARGFGKRLGSELSTRRVDVTRDRPGVERYEGPTYTREQIENAYRLAEDSWADPLYTNPLTGQEMASAWNRWTTEDALRGLLYAMDEDPMLSFEAQVDRSGYSHHLAPRLGGQLVTHYPGQVKHTDRVFYLPISDEMRKKATGEGFVLFKKRPRRSLAQGIPRKGFYSREEVESPEVFNTLDARFVGAGAEQQKRVNWLKRLFGAKQPTSKRKGLPVGQGRLYVNESAQLLITQLAVDMGGTTQDEVGGDQGGSIDPSGVPAFVAALQATAQANPEYPGIRKLAEQFQLAAAEGNGVIVINLDGLKRMDAVIRTLRHEIIHRMQDEARAGRTHLSPSHLAHFFADPIVQKAAESLVLGFGYPTTQAALALEIPAWLGSGDYAKLGLTRDEAVHALVRYFDVLAEKHGAGAAKVLSRLMPTLREEVIRGIQQLGQQAPGSQARYTPTARGGPPTITPRRVERMGTPGPVERRRESEQPVRYLPQRRQTGSGRPVRQNVSGGAQLGTPGPVAPAQPATRLQQLNKDLRERLKEVGLSVRDGINQLRDFFAPANTHLFEGAEGKKQAEQARVTRGLVRHYHGKISFQEARMRGLLEKFKAEFDKLPKELGVHGLNVIDAIEAFGDPTPGAALQYINNLPAGPLREFAKLARELFEQRRDLLEKLEILKHFVENYFPHLYKDEKKGKAFATKWMSSRSLAGSEHFKKQRTYPTLREALEDPQFTLKPRFDNPVDYLYAQLTQMDKSIYAHELFNDMQERGYLVFSRRNYLPGWDKIDDRMFTVFGPRFGAVKLPEDAVHADLLIPLLEADRPVDEKLMKEVRVDPNDVRVFGHRIMGHYFAPPQVARLINYDLHPGLRNVAAYRWWMGLKGVYNAVNLGFSAFHLGTTSLNALYQDLSLMLHELSDKNPKGAVLAAAEAARKVGLEGFVHDTLVGRHLQRVIDGREKNPSAMDLAVIDGLKRAGHRFLGEDYADFYEGLKRAIQAGTYGKAVARALNPLLLAQLVSRPIVKFYVPFMKYAAFAKAYAQEISKDPDMSPDKARKLSAEILDNLENSFGQMNHRNAIVNPYVRDFLNGIVGRLGWTWGNVRLEGGGAGSMAVQLGKILRGKKPGPLSRNSAFLLASTIFGMLLGGLTTWILSGTPPKDKYDYLYPRDGGTTEDGRPSRIIPPHYVSKDYISWLTRPADTATAKLTQPLMILAQLKANRDFYHHKIQGEDSMGLFKYLLSTWLPYVAAGAHMSYKRGEGFGKSVALPFFGFMPAGKRIGLDKAEQMITEYQDEHREEMTPLPTEFTEDRAKIYHMALQGQRDPKLLEQAKDLGRKEVMAGRMSKEQLVHLLERAQEGPFVSDVKAINDVNVALKVYDASTPEEKRKIQAIIRQKMSRARRNPSAWKPIGRELAQKYFQWQPPLPGSSPLETPAPVQ